ncbi:monovalent cation/H+ antiporter complex subunit F [Verrucosispora sp. WMMD703]|uniref:Membrane protein n=1 Tax=Micromonospora sediminimaris TaxID=547162 RepID=A0A9W5XHJ1_9ACTN|nr:MULTISPECIES: monovalent cation/H+ antiporter complex subunit F [Micromonospora]WFE42989.1 monovalent cation/H+ antiporter complex subunit F [Verrucosispora sp. WMMD1129]GIJ31145.1 membrane protein [Micromonospora sediminimaris]SFC24399.1 multicomponent Na+:H+ antiporter subunit F [Micromonospora sediminimaris]
MTAVAVTVTVLLAVAGGLTLTRVIRGPSILDRAVATDVLLAIIVAAIATEAAYSRDATALPVLVVLAVLGFVGSVSVARFAARRDDNATSTTSDGSQP